MKATHLIVFVTIVLSLAIWSAARGEGLMFPHDVSPALKSPEEIARLLAEQGKIVALPVPKGKLKHVIEKSEKAYDFPFGESKAVLFKLPDFVIPYAIKISSLCNCSGPSKSVFVPIVIFLDAEFKQTYKLEESDFESKYELFVANIKIHNERKADRYMFIYTRGDLIGKMFGTLRTFEGLFVRFNYPYLRASHGTLDLEISRPKK